MARALLFKTSGAGTPNPIQPANPPPPGSSPGKILYLSVHYTQNADGSLDGGYSYMAISGIYPLGNGIGDFIWDIQNQQVNVANRISPVTLQSNPPAVVVEDNCYIIFAIDPNGDAKFTAANPVKTDDARAGEYFNLVPVSDISSNPNSACHIVYFNAKSPTHNGSQDPAVADCFNLYLDVTLADGTTQTGKIDPDIKNTGHDGGGQGTHVDMK